MDNKEKINFSCLRTMEIQELERKRISMEIHDTTIQNLTMLVHKTEYVSMLMDRDLTEAKLELNTMTDILRQSIDELREIIYNLRPMSIDDLGLVASIDRYITQKQIDHKEFKYHFNVKNEENRNVVSVINLALFRVMQEALTNAQKHSKAENISVDLIYEKNNIILIISDDGIGFDVSEIKNKNFGIDIMTERVKSFSGTIVIESGKNHGARITVTMPVIEEEKNGSN